jgi:plasmid maintenance system antidote protein VapI
VQRRLAIAAREIAEAPHYDYVVVNSDLGVAANEIVEILAAERRRTNRLASPLSAVFGPPSRPAASGSTRASATGER